MGSRQWAMGQEGNGEEKEGMKRREERPPPSAAQTPPPSGRGRRKKEDEGKGKKKGEGMKEKEKEEKEEREEREEGKDGKKETEVSMGLAASSMVESEIGWWGRMGNVPFLVVIRVYRAVLSPVVGGQCRFEPTCSRYAAEAYRLYGPISGTKMTAGRICRCHPWNTGGFDPVAIPDDVDQKPGQGTQEGDENGTNAS